MSGWEAAAVSCPQGEGRRQQMPLPGSVSLGDGVEEVLGGRAQLAEGREGVPGR